MLGALPQMASPLMAAMGANPGSLFPALASPDRVHCTVYVTGIDQQVPSPLLVSLVSLSLNDAYFAFSFVRST